MTPTCVVAVAVGMTAMGAGGAGWAASRGATAEDARLGAPGTSGPSAGDTPVHDAVDDAVDGRIEDRNGDGRRNVLDLVGPFRGSQDGRGDKAPDGERAGAPDPAAPDPAAPNPAGSIAAAAPGGTAAPDFGSLETIVLESDFDFVEAGSPLEVTVRLTNSTVPLQGYSIELESMPLQGTLGSFVGVPGASSFVPSQNLFTAAGLTVDPTFTFIVEQPDGTVFANALTDDGSATVAVDGVNDVLARFVVTPAPGASGPFTLQLGAASVLADAAGDGVAFASTTIEIEAFPNPADIDLDGIVGLLDLLTILGNWGACPGEPDPCPADISGDGTVEFTDVLIVLDRWGGSS